MRRSTAALGLVVLCAAGTVAAATRGDAADRAAGPGAAGEATASRTTLGRSVQGRAITAVRVGDPGSARKALVVGSIHGDEAAGTSVTRQILRRFGDIRGVDLWVVKTVNPDGLARGARRNARGVDLNRNFSFRWRPGSPSSGYYPGPRPFSEPESRAVRRLVQRARPEVTIWFHQPWNQVLAPCRGNASLQRRYSRLSGIPLRRCRAANLPGTATRWQEHVLRGTEAFVVELPAGPLGRRAAMRNARAVVKVARDGAGRRRDWRLLHRLGGIKRQLRLSRAATMALPRPPIKRRLIPFPRKRKREMAAYSKRHYGERVWRLAEPKVIVEHIAVAGSVDSVFNAFAPDHPDPELGELPNVCAHFVVGANGRLYQLVGLHIRCRHTVGLNHTAIGIEHVGFDDGDLLGRRRQLRSSIRLTRWLRCRFGIPVRHVIGHNESRSSPFHFEKVPSLKQQTHGDMRRASMRVYRAKLRRRGPC